MFVSQSLRHALERYEAAGELWHAAAEVDPRFELAGILWRLKRGPAVLFTKLRGSGGRAVGNVLNTRGKFAAALNLPLSEVQARVVHAVEHPIEPRSVQEAPCQEVVVDHDIDLLKMFPIPTLSEFDAGPYISAGVCIAKHPDTGVRNVSINRLHIQEPAVMGTNIAPTHLHTIRKRCFELGRPLELAFVVGNHPAVLVASQCLLELGYDELRVAGGIFGEPLEVVKCRTVDLEVPAHAEIVIEAVMHPDDLAEEAPFGEFPGTYGGRKQNPRLHVKCVTHREHPILQVVSAGKHPEHLLIGGIAREATLFRDVRKTVPGTQRVFMSEGGSCRFHAVIAIKKRTEGEGKSAAFAAFASQDLLKRAIVVDEDIDIEDPYEVEWAIATRSDFERDIFVIPGAKSNNADPMAVNNTVAKMGIDATKALDAPLQRYLLPNVPAQVAQRVVQRWSEYFPDQPSPA